MIASPIQVTGGTPEASQAATAALQGAFGPRFFFRFYPFNAQFGVCAKWAEHDGRRIDIRTQQDSEERAFDLITFVPPDCSLEEAVGYVEKVLSRHPTEGYRRLAQERLAQRQAVVTPAEATWLAEFSNQAEVLVGNRGAKAVYQSDTEARSTRVSDTTDGRGD